MTTSDEGSSASLSPPRPRAQHRMPKETAHMNVLGRDGTDLGHQSSTTTSANTHLQEETVASKATLTDSSLSSGDAEGNSLNNGSRNADSSNANDKWWGKVWGTSGRRRYQGIRRNISNEHLSTSLSTSPLHYEENTLSLNGLDNSNPTVEDQLKQDCHFFYQGLEDEAITPPRKRGLRPLSTALNRSPRLMNSRDGARFYARYQQLNQDLDLDETIDRYSHDLALEEEGASTADELGVNVTDVHRSSLFYEQNGRLLMKLPRDQVRLVMDSDLESGIVSVEQWRHPEEDKNSSYSDTTNAQKPPLRYVMTVPDDLYKRVVSEMSYRLSPPCWGFFYCCHFHEGERADIGLALVILAGVLILLFIGTVDFHLK